MSTSYAQHSTPSTAHTATHDSARSGPTWWQALGAGAVTAAVVNVLVLGIGHLAGASFVVMDGGTAHPVNAGGVAFSSIVPILVGVGAAMVLALWRTAFLRIAQYAAAGLTVLSVAGPVTGDTDGGTVVALSVMHLVVGAAAVAALEAFRRHRLGR